MGKRLKMPSLRKKGELEAMGYTVITKWECHWNEEIEENGELKSYIDSLELVDPLNARDGLFGGRTGAVKLYHSCEDGEKLLTMTSPASIHTHKKLVNSQLARQTASPTTFCL